MVRVRTTQKILVVVSGIAPGLPENDDLKQDPFWPRNFCITEKDTVLER